MKLARPLPWHVERRQNSKGKLSRSIPPAATKSLCCSLKKNHFLAQCNNFQVSQSQRTVVESTSIWESVRFGKRNLQASFLKVLWRLLDLLSEGCCIAFGAVCWQTTGLVGAFGLCVGPVDACGAACKQLTGLVGLCCCMLATYRSSGRLWGCMLATYRSGGRLPSCVVGAFAAV